MSLLIDVLDYVKPKVKVDKEQKQKKEKIENVMNLEKDLQKLLNENVLYKNEYNNLKERLESRYKNEYEEYRINFWKQFMTLPPDVYKNSNNEYDMLSFVNELPKIRIEDVRTVADKLNLVVIPVEYMDIKEVLKVQENGDTLVRRYNLLSKIKEDLENKTNEKYNMYVLTPIDNYNVWRHITSMIDKPFYYPERFDNLFEVLELLIPTQRNLYINIKNTQNALKGLHSDFVNNINSLNRRIEKISNKLNRLEKKQKQVEMEQKQNEMEMGLIRKLNNLEEEIEKLYSQIDPILMLVKEDVNIETDSGLGITGLVWGKDFDDILFEMKNLKIKHSQLDEDSIDNIYDKYSEMLRNTYYINPDYEIDSFIDFN